jgi:HEAT repeat protein
VEEAIITKNLRLQIFQGGETKMSNAEFLKSAEGQLSDGTEGVRYTTVKKIAENKSVETLPLLIKAAGDSSYRVREEALNGICVLPQDVIFPKLEDSLRNHENANLRNVAIEAFTRFGKEAMTYLLRMLKDIDEEVRMFSATILGDVNDPVAVDDLINVLGDPDENVKHAAAESLGKIGDARAVSPLIDCLEQDFWIQYPAIIALGSIGDPSAISHLVELLDNEMLQQAVIETLGNIGDASVIPVLADILSQHDPTTRNNTIAALVNIQRLIKADGSCTPSIKKALNNGELIDHLLNSMHDPELEVKKNAVIALGWLKEKRAVKRLIELLTDYDLEEYVVGSLVSIGEDSLSELIGGLKNPDPKIRVSLIRCIEWIGHIDGIRACLPFLKNQNEDVRYQAVMAMGEALDIEEVEDELLLLLADPNPEIQGLLIDLMGKSRSKNLVEKLLLELSGDDPLRKYLAVQTLGRLKNPLAFDPLQRLLEDNNDELRAEAYKALDAIHIKPLSAKIIIKGLADKSPVVRRAVARCIEADSEKKVEDALFSLLNDPDPDVRLAAIETLGRIGGASCIEALTADFANCDKRLRLSIIRAMGNIHDKNSTLFLTDILRQSDPDLKRIALDSLGKIRDKRSIPNLIVALDDSDWSVRSAAIRALAQTGNIRYADTDRLLEKLEDNEDIVKKEAILALGQLKAKGAVNYILPLIHNGNLQMEVIEALEKLGIPDLEYFCDFFKRSNTRLKCLLVELLGRLADPCAVDFLLEVLKDEFFTVRCQAAKALGKLGGRKAVSGLLVAQKDDPSEDVHKEATLALKKLNAKK